MKTIAMGLLLLGCGSANDVDAGPQIDAGYDAGEDAGACTRLADYWQIAPGDPLSSTCSSLWYEPILVDPEGVTWGAVAFPGCRPIVSYAELDAATCAVDISIHCVDGGRELALDALVRGPIMRGTTRLVWVQEGGAAAYTDGGEQCSVEYDSGLTVCQFRTC
jgi:hypothetical protein